MERKKIVITGMGAVTPIGVGVETYWNNLIQGVSGIGTIQKLDVDALPIKVAAEVRDFQAKNYMPGQAGKQHGGLYAVRLRLRPGGAGCQQSGGRALPHRHRHEHRPGRPGRHGADPAPSCPNRAPGWGRSS